MNYAMQKKVADGDAIDLSNAKREGGHYIIDRVVPDKDYCDTASEAWMWSIGRRKSDGVLLASTTAMFYQNDNFECVWLR